VSCCPASDLLSAAEPVFSVFMCLMMQPGNVPFDMSLLVDMPKHTIKVHVVNTNVALAIEWLHNYCRIILLSLY